jgi:outer membrane protein TolC
VNALALVLLLASARPLTLDEATAFAIARDPGTAQARAAKEAASNDAFRAQLDRVAVSVDASVQELYNKPNLGGPTPPGSPDVLLGLSNLSASIQVPIFSGFRVSANVARAERLEQAADADVSDRRRALRVAVARAYWGVRRLALREQESEAALARLATFEEIVRGRLRAGLAAPVDENRAAARRAGLEADLAQLRAERLQSEARLAVLLGIDEDIELVDPIDARAVDDVDRDREDRGNVDAALNGRPEVRAAELRLRAAEESVRIVQSNFWPQLEFGMLAQVGNNPSVAGVGARQVFLSPNPFSGVIGDVQAGLSLRLNVFDGLQTWTAMKRAESDVRFAQEQLRSVEQVVRDDVRVARARLRGLHEQRRALQRGVPVLDDTRQILEQSYARGDVPLVDLLDTNDQLAQQMTRIVDVDAQLALAHIELALAEADDTEANPRPRVPPPAAPPAPANDKPAGEN